MTTVAESNVAAALEAWSQAIGVANVSTDEADLHAVQTTTFATPYTVPGIIRPGNTAEVQACVRIANQFKTPIYPISRGKNYGYGSRVPNSDGCVVMDLGRMNRIRDYSEQLAYMTVEPGVTQQQAADFLREQNSRLAISVSGAPPDASLIGSMLERGIGQGPGSDHFANACGFEVVLPTGELIHTGFGRYANAKSTPVHRWGVGPYVDGLFTQSNLGIVTSATRHMLPRSDYFQAFFFILSDESKLGPLIDRILELRLQGLIVGGYVIYNEHRIISLQRQYPWDEVGNQTPLPEEALAKARHVPGLFGARWMGLASVHNAGLLQGLGVRWLITKALTPVTSGLFFYDKPVITGVRMLYRLTKNELYRKAIEAYDKSPFMGNPMQGTVSQLYWRKRTPPDPNDLNPDRDQCGALWVPPAVPARSQDVLPVIRIAERVATAYAFEPNIGLNWAQDRCMDITISIHYDREVPGEDERAEACYTVMMQVLASEGYYPYRLGVQGQQVLPPASDDYAALLMKLKRTLDPNNILSPGRYDFHHEWPENV